MAKIKIRLGLDPDLDKSGYALIQHQPFGKPQIIELCTKPLFEVTKAILEVVKRCEEDGSSLLVCIEAGYLNKIASYHAAPSKAAAAKIGMNVGMNHAIGMKLEEFCVVNQIPYKLYKPTNEKWDARKFKLITGYDKRSSQETRDAVRAAWP